VRAQHRHRARSWRGAAGQGGARPGLARQGLARRGKAREWGLERERYPLQARLMARRGAAGSGWARRGEARQGSAWLGAAGRPGVGATPAPGTVRAMQGWARRGAAELGAARRCRARPGPAGRGKAWEPMRERYPHRFTTCAGDRPVEVRSQRQRSAARFRSSCSRSPRRHQRSGHRWRLPRRSPRGGPQRSRRGAPGRRGSGRQRRRLGRGDPAGEARRPSWHRSDRKPHTRSRHFSTGGVGLSP
jgi:hypothetical protein